MSFLANAASAVRKTTNSLGLTSDWATLPAGSGVGLVPATEIVEKLKGASPIDISKVADYEKGLALLKALAEVASSRGEADEDTRDDTDDVLAALRMQKGVVQVGDPGTPEPDGSPKELSVADFKAAAALLGDLLSRYDAVKNAVSKKGTTAGSRKRTRRRGMKVARRTRKGRRSTQKRR